MEQKILENLQNRLEMASKRMDDSYAAACKRAGIAAAHMDILYVLRVFGEGCTQTELRARCYTNKQTLNSAVHKMVDDGLIRIEPTGGREKRLYLTKAGTRRADEVIDPLRKAELEAADELGEKDLDRLVELTERYSHLLCEKLDAKEGR